MEYCVRKGRYEEIKQSVYNTFLWNLNQELKLTQKNYLEDNLQEEL